MTTSGYAPSPHDWPPNKVSTPQTFKNTDLYPALTVKATRAKLERFIELTEKEDELGICVVAQFTVINTLVMFYQSGLDSKDNWTVFVDMHGCVDNGQLPTRLGSAVVRRLTAGGIMPEWTNDDADKVYRSRRRKPSQAGTVVAKPTATQTNRSLPRRIKVAYPHRGAANDSRTEREKGSGTAADYYMVAKKAATTQKSEGKKAAAKPAKKVVAKKPAAIKKATPKKAAPLKK